MSTTEYAAPESLAWRGHDLLGALRAGAHWLEQHAELINALNVFPVPDGDTGTNMSLTMSGAVQDIEADPSCAVVADKVRYWATMRGRGNSGIILSQVLRGLSLGMAGHETIDGKILADALAQASATAYKAVMKPIEGTMLTVIRETSEAARISAESGADVHGVLSAAVAGADASVERTPELLKTLRDAGVVDSGGKGLAILFEGMRRYAFGESLESGVEAIAAPAMSFDDIHGPDDFGYCTNFIIKGQNMAFEQFRADVAAMGESTVIVGDDELIKVHIHMLDPGSVLSYALGYGALTGVEITNMDMQRENLHTRAQSTQATAQAAQLEDDAPEMIGQVGVVAVVLGEGFRKIFRSLNVGKVITGEQLMNPSAEELLAAIEQLPQQDVIILPNNSNVIMTARQAAELSAKRVAIVPTRTIPQGIAAMFGYNFQADLDENSQAMTETSTQVSTAEITTAVRDATVDGVEVRAGQLIGMVDGDMVAANETHSKVYDALMQAMDLPNRELVTVYYGKDTAPADAEALAAYIQQQNPVASVEVQAGGQGLYDYIIAAE
ncbi:MAG: DAK2 domain-containing protein [Roseiflexaceae bacterium]|nr:DAK2 domain-containing protein [Roseiflexaceae bacterium]